MTNHRYTARYTVEYLNGFTPRTFAVGEDLDHAKGWAKAVVHKGAEWAKVLDGDREVYRIDDHGVETVPADGKD